MERRRFFKLGLAGIGTMALAKKAFALQFYSKSSDKKWAVLYATWTGTARDAGVWISEGMEAIADVFDIRENHDLRGYDHIVIGSAIRAMKIHPQLQEYLEQSQGWLKEKIRGLYIVCGNRGQPVGPEQTDMFIHNHLAKVCGISNVPARALDGRMTKSLLEPEILEMMKKQGVPDWDNLKRTDCMQFGETILKSVTS